MELFNLYSPFSLNPLGTKCKCSSFAPLGPLASTADVTSSSSVDGGNYDVNATSDVSVSSLRFDSCCFLLSPLSSVFLRRCF